MGNVNNDAQFPTASNTEQYQAPEHSILLFLGLGALMLRKRK
ncbi:MAG: PEP-CTERM sorting domain-containing protein [Planctomycetota bacterium]